MKKNLFVILLFLLAVTGYDAKAQSGANDPTFNPTYEGFDPGTGANRSVLTNIFQPDGKIIIGGSFTSFNGTTRRRLARLNADGSVDITFDPGSGASTNSTIYTTALQSDGKIIIGGNFTSYNQITRRGLARVNNDGSLDASFTVGYGTGQNSTVFTTAIQSDGKIIIGGYFSTYNGTSRNCIARVNSNGSIDTTFKPGSGANNTIYKVAIQSDGKIIVAGSFTNFNGTSINRIVRLNSNGSIDATFVPGTAANGSVRAIDIQTDGKIIIGGNFTSYNGTSISRIARLNSDGTLDAAFIPGTGANDYVCQTVLQTDGKIILGGEFTTINATSKNRITRLNSDGSIDATFVSGTAADSNIWAAAIKSDGKIIIGGDFTSYDGTSRNRFARLNSDGSLDTACVSCTGANEVVRSTNIQSNGKIIIGGYFTFFNGTAINRIARLNSDGSLDASFDPGSGPDAGVTTTALQSDGKIIIGGNFEEFNGIPVFRIARLNTDGSLDITFTPDTGANKIIYAAAIQSDGKILIGGEFDSVSGAARSRIARLNSDGSLDATFDPGAGTDGYINTICVQNDGKIIIGGMFTTYNGTSRNNVARLNSDGSLDVTFDPGTGANSVLRSAAIQSDGKIIIGGSFTSYNGITINRLARLNSDGSLDASFNTSGAGANISVYTITIQSNGKIYVAGGFTTFNGTTRNRIARLNSNGTLDAAFDPGSGANNIIFTAALQSDEKVIIGGGFTTYNGADRYRAARIINNTVVGLPENNFENKISLYPNPTSGLLMISSDIELENATIKLWDTQGRLIFEKSNISGNQCAVDISKETNGVYFVGIIQDNNISRLKVIKN